MQHSAITDTEGIHEPKGHDSALAGQVYVSDGAGSGAWTSPVYGELYITGNALTFTPVAADIAQFKKLATTGWTEGEYSGVTLNTDDITVDTAGTYSMNFWCNVKTSAASGTQFAFSYAVDDTPTSRQILVQKNSTGADYITVAAAGITTLTAAAIVSIYVSSSATTTLTIEDAGFSLIKL